MNQTPILLKDKISEETQYSIDKFYRNGHFYTNAQLYEFRREVLATIENNRIEKKFNNTLSNRVTAASAKETVEYLIGDVDNHNLFGSILGFSKKKGNRFSFFLYYSHETGRVERILFNPGSTRDDLNLSYGDLKMNNLTINDERIFNKYNFQSIHLEKNQVPQIIKDLKTFINSRTITDRLDLILKVSEFNKRSINKIFNIFTNGQYNQNMVINDRSINLKIKPTTKRFEMKGYKAP
uniref:Uncharacterized protein n=1 Tax=Coniophora puteana TaxID=80637 RepID=A0A896YZ03_9AGAM